MAEQRLQKTFTAGLWHNNPVLRLLLGMCPVLAVTAALDRTLLHHHFVVPGYTLRNARIARWDRFSHPAELPEFSSGFPTIWWWDADKAAKTGGTGS